MTVREELTKEKLEQLISENYRFYQIAELFNCSPAYVTKLAKKLGVKSVKSGEWRCTTQKISKTELERDYLEEKLSTIDITKKYGIGMGTLHRLFEIYEINTRSKIVGARISKAKKVNADVQFFRLNSPEKFYVLGLIASDGCISGNSISFTSKDLELITYFHTITGITNPMQEQIISLNGKKFKSYKSQFSSVEVVEILNSYGITARKSLTFVPKNIPKEYFSDFMRGIFNGDGSVSISKRKDTGVLGSKFSIITASIEFAEIVRDSLESLGIKVNKINKCKRKNALYIVSSSSRVSIATITKWMYGDDLGKFGLSRKKNKMIQISELALT